MATSHQSNDMLKKRIHEEFKKYVSKLETTDEQTKLSFEPRDFGYPHVEIKDEKNLFYVVTERGIEIERRQAKSLDDLMYWLVSDIIFSQAVDYSKEHRQPSRDFRRQLFSRELELFGLVNPNWTGRKKREIISTLKNSPYVDT